MKKKSLFIALVFCTVLCFTQEINCRLRINFKNKKNHTYSYINNESGFYFIDSVGVESDSLCLSIQDPFFVTLFINNDPEHAINFYIEDNDYEMIVYLENKNATFVNSVLNSDYKEKMKVHDSLYKKYNLIHAMFYPYNKMNRDSAHEILKKYLSFCDSLSDIHVNKFYETHPNSFLTLEAIYNDLVYTFDNPEFDTTVYNKAKLQKQFEKLDLRLSRYKLYQNCIDLLSKEYPKKETPPIPLFPINRKN